MSHSHSLYDVLGLRHTATEQDVKRAYYALALMHHPDRSQGAPSDKFVAIQAAFEVLGDRSKRVAYDRELEMSTALADKISAEIPASELDLGESDDELVYHCRCGAFLSIDAAALAPPPVVPPAADRAEATAEAAAAKAAADAAAAAAGAAATASPLAAAKSARPAAEVIRQCDSCSLVYRFYSDVS